MTINVLNKGAYSSVLGRDNRLQNVGQQAQSQPAIVKPQTEQAVRPSQRAEKVIADINNSTNVSAAYKRDAIFATAIVDAAAPPAQRDEALRALAGQFSKGVKANASAPAKLDADEVSSLVQNARDQLFGPRPRGEDNIELTMQARARGAIDGLQEKPVVEAAYNIGQSAVANIFGDPPGVKQVKIGAPEPVQLPPARLPHEQLEHLAEIRQQMVDIIES